jgi:putative transposase
MVAEIIAALRRSAIVSEIDVTESRGVPMVQRHLRRATRKHPAHGILIPSRHPTVVFLTVCTKDRRPWLANPDVHGLLRSIWLNAEAWLVGRYVLMPDHLHLFCAPNEDGSAGASPSQAGAASVPLDNWVRYWKSQFSKRHGNPVRRWQSDHWDTRLRREESYDAKWEYVRNNPVRAGLVERADDWLYEGEIHVLRW